ncbi:MAG: bifunctional histidinol-phosphatase/imidazoleglycerol-phosphate dehydratase HisB [Proteobacteria bacterium]|nr:bifunctional histidinol-phosphatase/imidazoleglycerol-phosphate dehydratase HisB [Pseudomonadota bacterium]
MATRRILFIDRDGTLIRLPDDQQIDSPARLALMPLVIPALVDLRLAGFGLVMIADQAGPNTAALPHLQLDESHRAMLELFASQGIEFDDILICSHGPDADCDCRKPRLGLVRPYLTDGEVDLTRSHVIGDGQNDTDLARNMGISAFRIGTDEYPDWRAIARAVTDQPRRGRVHRKTRETAIDVAVDLDGDGASEINTGIGFFDHMLEQLAKHSGIDVRIAVVGDLHVDEHHTVEDTALALGSALRQALGDKVGIGRYGFILPMDEAEARVSIDLSARPYLVFTGSFGREKVGGLPTELVSHFFRSLSDSMGATLHIHLQGENAHHMIESAFKGLARALRQAVGRTGRGLPSTKGAL